MNEKMNILANFSNHTTRLEKFDYLGYNWYEENNIYYGIDHDQLIDLGGIENFTTKKCPQKILDKCVHQIKKIGKFHFLIYNKYGIIIYYQSKYSFSKDIMKMKYLKKYLYNKYKLKLWFGKVN